MVKTWGCGQATLFWRIEAAIPFYIWMGIGDWRASADDDLEPSAMYSGCGYLREAPPLAAMRNGQADIIELALSGGRGIPQAYIDDPQSAGIIGARVTVGVVGLDNELQPLGKIAWFWPGRVGQPSSRADQGGQIVSLSVYNGKVLRSRAGLRKWSNASHQARHPGDRLCERTGLLRVPSRLKWPQ